MRSVCDQLSADGRRGSVNQSAQRRSQVRVRVVGEECDKRMALEGGLHDAALDALPASVDEAQAAETGLVRGANVLLDDGGDVGGREGVQIKFGLDRNGMGLAPIVVEHSRVVAGVVSGVFHGRGQVP